MPHQTLTTGLELYYESHGKGPAVTFLHGAGGSHLSWWQQVPEFSRRYRCITIDHRGYGQTVDANDQGMAAFAGDLEALLDELGLQRTALVAQSMGGLTALEFALRRPERVTALAMCDTWGFFDWPEGRSLLRNREPGTNRPGGMGKRYPREHPEGAFLYQQLSALNPPLEGRLAVDRLALGSPERPSRANVPTRKDVEQLSVPALFLVGGDDPLVPPELIRMTASLVQGSEYVEVPGAGHSTYFEDAPAFNQLVGGFLAKHAV